MPRLRFFLLGGGIKLAKINPEIFREYDIRGLAETDLSPCFTYLLGRAFGLYFR
jgi:phosphomannomutase / phosphoglucomutase